MSLHVTITSRNVDAVRRAIDDGADVNELRGNFSVLEKTITAGNLEIIKALLEAGADQSIGVQPALVAAYSAQNQAVVDLLFQHGADPKKSPRALEYAMHWSAEAALGLLDRGALFLPEFIPGAAKARGAPEARAKLIGRAIAACAEPQQFLSALIASRLDVEPEWIRQLLAKGASLTPARHPSPLHEAARLVALQPIQVLLELGASLDTPLAVDWETWKTGQTVRDAFIEFVKDDLKGRDASAITRARVKRLKEGAKVLGVDLDGKASERLKKAAQPKAKAKAPVVEGGEKVPPPRDATAEARIEAEPADRARVEAYGKWLREHENPLGELIAAQLAGGDGAAVLKKHAALLLGPLARFPKDRVRRAEAERSRWKDEKRGCALEWKNGFLEHLELRWDDTSKKPEQDLKEVFELATARFLESLRVGPFPARGRTMTAQPALEALVETGAATRLRALHLTNIGRWDWGDTNTGDFGAVHAHFRKLETLTLNAGTIQLGKKASLPELRTLAIQTGALSRATLNDVLSLEAPKLERLSIWFGRAQYGGNTKLGDVAAILDGSRFPKLRHLGLMNCEWVGEAVRALPSSKVLGRLRSLDLSMGCLSDADVAAMQEQRAAFGHLERLELHDNGLSKKAVTKGLAAQVELGKQDPKRAARYASVGE